MDLPLISNINLRNTISNIHIQLLLYSVAKFRVLEHDEDMWASIERAQARGIPFKEMPRIFKLARSAFLSLTRRNVARTENFALSEWKPQRYFMSNKQSADDNAIVINSFKQKYSSSLEVERHNKVQVHAVLRGQNYRTLYDELLSKLSYVEGEILNKQYFSLLDEALEKLNLEPAVDICWIRDVEWSTRKILADGSIQQLFQGRNPNLSSPLYYEGDRSLADKYPEHIQLQIHFVKPTNLPEVDFYAPVLALYIPEYCACELEKLVVKA